MDIEITKNENVQISLSQKQPIVSIKSAKNVDVNLNKNQINISPKIHGGPAFNFVQRIMAGSSVVRLTYGEFNALTRLDGKTWYAVTTTSDELRYLYLGATLIAKASEEQGTWGFAYTFPMTFGR